MPEPSDPPGGDVAGACLDCRTIFLLPREPLDRGIAGGRAPAAPCPRCDGLVVAVEACTDRLAQAVGTIRQADVLRRSTMLALALSWRRVEPSPLAALAELGPVAPELIAVLDVEGAPLGVRLAVGALLLSTLVPLLEAAASDERPAEAARRILVDRIAGRVSDGVSHAVPDTTSARQPV